MRTVGDRRLRVNALSLLALIIVGVLLLVGGGLQQIDAGSCSMGRLGCIGSCQAQNCGTGCL